MNNITETTMRKRFKVIHTYTGALITRANTFEELRAVIDKGEADYFTLHDLKEGSFSGAGIIFNDAEQFNQNPKIEKV